MFRTRSIYVLFHGEEETYIQRQEVKAVLKPKYHGGHMSMETEMESEEVIKREKRSIFKYLKHSSRAMSLSSLWFTPCFTHPPPSKGLGRL